MEMTVMFQDRRGKKLLLVAHCILNQNSKIDACAYYPGAIREAAQAILDAEVGIIQLPCPELLCLGLDRQADKAAVRSIESEDTRVAERMKEAKALQLCREIAGNVVYQIEEYQKHGFQVLGLLGVNGSPTCGVDTTWAADKEFEGRGVLTEIIGSELQKKGISITMAGLKAKNPEHAVAVVKKLVCQNQ